MEDNIKGTSAEEEKKNIVDGIQFASEADAALGLLELKKVLYLKRHLDYQSADMILQVYQKALDDKTFQTPIGLAFVRELRERLIKEGMSKKDLAPMPIYYNITPPGLKGGLKSKKDRKKDKKKEKVNKFRISVLLNILLAALALGMVAVAMTGNNPNILNYKRAVTNEYAAWEQELTEREKAVREKELELGRE